MNKKQLTSYIKEAFRDNGKQMLCDIIKWTIIIIIAAIVFFLAAIVFLVVHEIIAPPPSSW